MRISVRLLASYRRYIPDLHDPRVGYELEIGDHTSVANLLSGLPIPREEPATILVNGKHASGEQMLEDGDVVAIFPAVGGG